MWHRLYGGCQIDQEVLPEKIESPAMNSADD